VAVNRKHGGGGGVVRGIKQSTSPTEDREIDSSRPAKHPMRDETSASSTWWCGDMRTSQSYQVPSAHAGRYPPLIQFNFSILDRSYQTTTLGCRHAIATEIPSIVYLSTYLTLSTPPHLHTTSASKFLRAGIRAPGDRQGPSMLFVGGRGKNIQGRSSKSGSATHDIPIRHAAARDDDDHLRLHETSLAGATVQTSRPY
jgi:hypothetical protein